MAATRRLHYRDADDQLFMAFQAQAPTLLATIKTTGFPFTYRALIGFVFKINALKTGIFDAVDNDNPYVLRILFRCLCEHYLKFTHIFMRFLKERTDQPGSDFFNYCGAAEIKDYAKALSHAEALLGRERVIQYQQTLLEFYPDTGELSAREIERRSAEFSYKEILRTWGKAAPGLISEQSPFLATIIPAYAELSSFVHGGPLTDSMMPLFRSKEEKKNAASKAGLTFQMVASVYFFCTLVICQEFKQFAPLASTIKAILENQAVKRPRTKRSPQAEPRPLV